MLVETEPPPRDEIWLTVSSRDTYAAHMGRNGVLSRVETVGPRCGPHDQRVKVEAVLGLHLESPCASNADEW